MILKQSGCGFGRRPFGFCFNCFNQLSETAEVPSKKLTEAAAVVGRARVESAGLGSQARQGNLSLFHPSARCRAGFFSD